MGSSRTTTSKEKANSLLRMALFTLVSLSRAYLMGVARLPTQMAIAFAEFSRQVNMRDMVNSLGKMEIHIKEITRAGYAKDMVC